MCSQMLVAIEINSVGINRHFIEHSFKFGQPENGFNATDVERLILSVFGTFPYCDKVISLLQKQHFAKAIFMSIRE